MKMLKQEKINQYNFTAYIKYMKEILEFKFLCYYPKNISCFLKFKFRTKKLTV